MDDIDGRPTDGREPRRGGSGRRDRDRDRRPGRRSPAAWNPHVVVLVVGGLALVAIGVRLYRSALDVVYSDFTGRGLHGISESDPGEVDAARELVTMQVEWTVGPLLIAFGILAVLVGITVLAVRWRRGTAP
jgi:hypothetical protein